MKLKKTVWNGLQLHPPPFIWKITKRKKKNFSYFGGIVSTSYKKVCYLLLRSQKTAKLRTLIAPMAVPPSETEPSANRNLLSHFYHDFLRNRLTAIYLFSPSHFLSNLTSRFRSTRRRECLPLPFPSNSLDSFTYVHFPLSLQSNSNN